MASLRGGNVPENNSHFVIERPESVSLVRPPTTIIKAIKKNMNISHNDICFLSKLFSIYI